MNYAKEIEFIKAQMIEAYNLFCSKGDKRSQKATFDIVTETDKEIEKFLTEKIKSEYPFDLVMGEEFSSTQLPEKRCWTIDPIDGTFNFAYGLSFFGIQASLIDNGEIVMGAIYLPYFKEFYEAEIGKGAYLNGKRIFVDKNGVSRSGVVSIGDFSRKKEGKLAKKQFDMLKKLYGLVAKVRMFGAACVDFSTLSSGKIHATTLITKNLWDIAPGIAISREAGAIVTDLEGNPYNINAEGVISACNEEFSNILVKCYKE